MTGTAKQIQWAEDIIKKIEMAVSDYSDAAKQVGRYNARDMAVFERIIDLLHSEDVTAGEIIDFFGGVKFTCNWQETIREIAACLKVHYADTAWQRKLKAALH